MKLGFYHLSEAWYADACLNVTDYVDEVMFGMYDENGGTSGEIAMRWVKLHSSITPQLQIFDDAWAILTMIPEVIAELGDLNGQYITPKQFTQLLLDNGFTDMTPRKSPYKKAA